jgi:ubiquitin-like 1-activating enzyme E1 A
MTENGVGEELTADEIALYDRQLRLWGIEAQNRMRKANILLITIKALGNEIAKNLVLAGVGVLTVLDCGNVTEQDVASEFFVTAEDIRKNVRSLFIVSR